MHRLRTRFTAACVLCDCQRTPYWGSVNRMPTQFPKPPLPIAGALIASLLFAAAGRAADAGPDEAMADAGHAMSMPGMYGPYGMTRESSGTSWQPESADMEGLHRMSGAWMTMASGQLSGIYTHQGGPRGGEQVFNESMAMVMARRALDDGAIGLRAMASFEPLMGPRGYPLLFQTGESANGIDPLIDRQHPHNLLLEVAASYSRTLGSAGSVFLYGGPVAEPALGPPAFMHRFSSEDNPEAPLSHHWLDSTHVAFGVVTAGLVQGAWKLEASAFNGREPDQHRYDVQLRGLDSGSVRVSFNPNAHWALQVSAGRLASPEQLEPEVAVRRTTISAMHDAHVGDVHWQATVAVGRNSPTGHHATTAAIADAAVHFRDRHTLFMRVERTEKDELFAAGHEPAGGTPTVSKLSVGYVLDLLTVGHVAFGIGGVASAHWIPAELVPSYGERPSSYTLFVRAKLVR